ncbi:MAG: VCBS repeat-containing protein [Bryobacteraceae bacterium]
MLIFAFFFWFASRPADIPFQKHELDLGANETCAFADLNGDGRLDIVSGENWYEAPRWVRHKFREFNFAGNYIDNFSDLAVDVNGDGRLDLVSVSYFTKRMAWFENPGKGGEWKEHLIDSGFPNEFTFLVDLNNDGKALELLTQSGDIKSPLAWYELVGAFVKHVVSPQSYGHGIGAGDVNGDGRNDILTPKGWFEAPADPRTGSWKMHTGLQKAEAWASCM